MKSPSHILFPATLRLAFFAFCIAVAGCGAPPLRKTNASAHTKYWSVVSSDYEGKVIAEFVAEGDVKKEDDGYSLTAVERRIFQPSVMEFHYPLGRTVTVAATNVVVTPTVKPLWLAQMDDASGAPVQVTGSAARPPAPACPPAAAKASVPEKP